MTVKPVPNLTAEDPLPFDTIEAYSGEVFIVFAQGKNVQGGKEWLRLLFSQEGAKFFSEATKSLTVVDGAAEGLDLGTAFASVDAAIKAAGSNTFTTRYAGWYPDLDEESKLQVGNRLTGQATVEEVSQALQKLTDEIRDNPDIPKFTREAPGASAAATPAS
jgi:N-acetylglucosamine transport system substrate-binding protein